MELSRTSSSAEYSTTRILQFSTSKIKTSFLIPKRATYCIPKIKCSNYLLPASRVYTQTHSSKLFCQPRKQFPKVTTLVAENRKTIFSIKASSNEKEADKLDSPLAKLSDFTDVLLRFTRPHIIFGTVLAFACVMARTWMENAHLVMIPKWILLLRAMVTLVSLICADGFVNTVNQIYDIEIDKINKPHYPLASGELSLQSAWTLVICFSTIGIAVPLLLRSGFLLVWILWMFIQGIIYSVPPWSTKRSTFGAILTCASLRGYTFTLCLSAATRTVLGLPFQLSKPVIFMAIFTTFFALVCGALKDIEDIEGDKKCNVPTLVSIYGPKKVAFFGFGTILLSYVGATITAILMPQVFRLNVMIPAHIFLASYLIFQAWKWDKENYSKEASQSVYKSIWKLFDMEYILFPFI